MNIEQYNRYLQMMDQWLIIKHEGKGLQEYFLLRNYKKIGIYGMSVYGRHVIRELNNSQINIAYGIDQKELKPYRDINTYHLSENLPSVDVIVNTVIHEHNYIKSQIESILKCPIVSLEDVVYDSYE